MKKHKMFINFIKDIDKNAIVFGFPKDLIQLTGGIEDAVFLNQVIYWCDRTYRKDGYFYKSDKEWNSELGLTRCKLERIREKLKGFGYIQTKKKKANGAPTLHYKVMMDKICEDLKQLHYQKDINEKDETDNEQQVNEQIEMEKTDKTEMHETSISEMGKISNSITENTQKSHQKLEQKDPVLNDENINISQDENEKTQSEIEIKELLYNEMIENIKSIFPNAEIDNGKREQIRAIAYSVNCYYRDSDHYSKDKPDLHFILEKLNWAREIARNDPSFNFNNLMTALTKPENLDKYHAWHNANRKIVAFNKDRILHPLNYLLFD